MLVDVSDFLFCCSPARGRGSPRGQEGGVSVFKLKSQHGGSPRRGRRGASVAGRVSVGNFLGGGGAKYFLPGPVFVRKHRLNTLGIAQDCLGLLRITCQTLHPLPSVCSKREKTI